MCVCVCGGGGGGGSLGSAPEKRKLSKVQNNGIPTCITCICITKQNINIISIERLPRKKFQSRTM